MPDSRVRDGGVGKATSSAIDYPPACFCPSPNFGERVGDTTVSMLILHFTGMENSEAAINYLADPKSRVSAHYVVREDGGVIQMVAEAKRAWHAGVSFWQGKRDINSCSVGIEIANKGDTGDFPHYPAEQIRGLIKLCQDIIARYAIKSRYILGHSDIAPERKVDPGERFPWADLNAAGVGLYVPPAPLKDGVCFCRGQSGCAVEALQSMLALYGYHVPVSGEFDKQTELAVAAFQRHFRPQKIDGLADNSTILTLQSLMLKLKEF